MRLHAVDEALPDGGEEGLGSTAPLDTVVHARVLDPESSFSGLPRPGYDPDVRGIRRGVAPTLSVIGGVLVAVSPFGAWLRVTGVPAEGAATRVLGEQMGRDIGSGLAITVFGVGAVVAMALWNRRSTLYRGLAHLLVVVAAVVTGVALLALQGRIGEATARAIQQAGFFELDAGVGWGAWAALVGAALLVLASAFAFLTDREETSSDGGEGS